MHYSSDSLKLSRLGFGGSVLGWLIKGPEAHNLLDRFSDAGMNLVDTADVYMRRVSGLRGGESETLIGEWLHSSKRRDKIILSTKVGSDGLAAEQILKGFEQSLRRLQTEFIDIYFAHQEDPRTPLEESLEAFTRLLNAGKVGALGVSNFSISQLNEFLKLGAPVRYLQAPYNFCQRGWEQSFYPALCQKHDITFMAHSALAGGFLSGKYRREADLTGSSRPELVRQYLPQIESLDQLEALAHDRGLTMAAAAIAWLSRCSSLPGASC